MFPQRIRLTCWQSSAGCAASVANARTAAWRFDISSAAGMPLPTTSAIESAETRGAKRDRVEAVAADAGRGLPRRRELAAVHLRERRGQQLALDAAGLVEFAPLVALQLAARASLLDLGAQRADELLVVPRLLHEVADAAAHRFHRKIHRSPAGHHDDREQAVVLLHAREQIDPLASRGGVAGVVEIHQEQVVRAARDGIDDRVRRRDGVHDDAFAFEQKAKRIEQIGLIVGNQNARRNGAGRGHGQDADVQGACHG